MRFVITLLILVGSVGCDYVGLSSPPSETPGAPANAIEAYLASEFPPADGFDFPVGDANGEGSYSDRATGESHRGWYVATRFNEAYELGLHPGEDWNGRGGGDTDMGQPVHSIGAGRVAFAGKVAGPWGNVVMIDHVYYENSERRSVRSLYAHLEEVAVSPQQLVARRDKIGTIGKDPAATFAAHLHLEVRRDSELDPGYWPSSNGRDAAWISEHYLEPREFISSRRSLFVPQNEDHLFLVDTKSKRARFLRAGHPARELEVAFGQAEGAKQIRDDLKTPIGMYFVVDKSRGPFSGAYAEYFGGHWIKINYPNRYDGERGLRDGLVTDQQSRRIAAEWSGRKLTWQGSRLGDGIGFHGWRGEWDEAGSRQLSFGCIVLKNSDIAAIFDEIPIGTMVVIM